MVKVSIRDYMPPYTTWMQVELEEELCGSATIQNEMETSDIGIDNQQVETNFNYTPTSGTSQTDPGWDIPQ